ncbi:hypothetical protein ACTJIJ_09460 [Niabella sp. 22666]|uniref:hypothetical protein n=1 Tax=Niabella sp. 22666 TaxID=3453954 RepID=UPI003F82BC68
MKQIGLAINEYIINNWLCDYMYEDGSYMFTQFAKEHYIEEKIARKIVKESNYLMTIETLEKMCSSRDITLSEFFQLLKR